MIRSTIVRLSGMATVVVATMLAGAASASAVPHKTTVQKEATITTDYETFFSGKTSAKTKIGLLQNGSAFTSIIDAQSSSSIAKSTTAKVTSVTITSSTEATVKYSIYLDGNVALKNQTGEAVYQQNTWKVGSTSFCALLALEQTKTKACPSK